MLHSPFPGLVPQGDIVYNKGIIASFSLYVNAGGDTGVKKDGQFFLIGFTVLFAVFLLGMLIGRGMNKPPVIIQEVTTQATQALEETVPSESTSTGLSSTGKININTASAALLDTLPGVGPVLAQRIVDYRESIAPFRQISDLTNVEGIGNATLMKIEDLITVED